jgi:uncharacterized protein YndB with AHSA1/START domain
MKIVGPYTSPTIYSEHPGIVELTSSDPSVASVDASVVIPGTREYRLDGRGGDYLAYPGVGQDREDVTWLFEVDFSRTANAKTSTASSFPVYPIAMSVRQDIDRRTNWYIGFRRYLSWINDTLGIIVTDSLDNLTGDAIYITYNLIYVTPPGRIKFALTKATGGAYALHWGIRGPLTSGTHNSTGTMGGDEVLILNQAVQLSKISRICDNAELDAWFGAGSVVPATNREFAYLGNHEIIESVPVIYESADPPHDLYAYTVNRWQAPGMSVAYTDDPGNPVVPFQPFTITPNSTGTFTITARRRRQGVPDRATDEEKYETTSETFTITEMPAEVVQYVRLLITTSTQGTVDIASSDPAVVTFPASVVVGPTLQYEVLGTVVGAGTSTITTSMGGAVLDTTTVTIEDTPTVIEAGPPQNLRTRI